MSGLGASSRGSATHAGREYAPPFLHHNRRRQEMRLGALTRDHFVQPQRGFGGLRLGNHLNAGVGATVVNLVDEVAVVTTKTLAAGVSVRTIGQRREVNCASVIN